MIKIEVTNNPSIILWKAPSTRSFKRKFSIGRNPYVEEVKLKPYIVEEVKDWCLVSIGYVPKIRQYKTYTFKKQFLVFESNDDLILFQMRYG